MYCLCGSNVQQFSIQQISDVLWSAMNSYKGIITKPMFSKIFRSCRINCLLSKPVTSLPSEIMGNYMYYTPDGTITVESSTVFISLWLGLTIRTIETLSNSSTNRCFPLPPSSL